MCTALSYKNLDRYFGRNLDVIQGFDERIVISPRRHVIPFRHKKEMEHHYSIIGMATVANGYPLFYDATNECGLSMAGLNFPENAFYNEYNAKKDNIAPFEFIPWILCQCSRINEVKTLLGSLNLINTDFSNELSLTPLHWLISDTTHSITVEAMREGLFVHDNQFEVLTNNPPFDFHKTNMSNYMSLHSGASKNQFKESVHLQNYSLGMGALGLPGDFSSASRFIRAFFVKENSISEQDENSSVNQFFHILNSVAMPKGCVEVNGRFEYTLYSSCCNISTGIYYYTTYNNSTINSVCMHDIDLEENKLFTYDLIK